MSKARIAAWNAEGMFVTGSKTRRATPHDALKVVKRLDADVLFVPEFGMTDTVDESTIIALHSLGYQTVIYSYDQPELGSYGAALLSRLPLKSHTVHAYNNTSRKFLEAHVELSNSHTLRVVGVHLDDRTEQLRLGQIEQVAEIVNRPHVGETVVLGDFNAMPIDSRFARLVRSKPARFVGENIPHELMKSMSMRVSEMGLGTTIERLLELTDLHDLDGKSRRTVSAKQAGLEWAPSIRLAKIDWVFGSEGIEAVGYRVLPDVGGDHRPVVVDIET